MECSSSGSFYIYAFFAAFGGRALGLRFVVASILEWKRQEGANRIAPMFSVCVKQYKSMCVCVRQCAVVV